MSAPPKKTEQAGFQPLLQFPRTDGSRTPYIVFNSQQIYDLRQQRIFRGPVWSFLGLEAEISANGDFKSTPVVTRTEDGGLAAWVNKCAHRGAVGLPNTARQCQFA